jgi:hypothetical protein
VLQPFEPVKRGVRLHGDALDGGVHLLEAAGDAHEGAAGAQAGNKMRDAPAGLVPDFEPGAVVVRLPVGVVRILVHVAEARRVVPNQLTSAQDGAVGAAIRVGPLYCGAVCVQDVFALRRNV